MPISFGLLGLTSKMRALTFWLSPRGSARSHLDSLTATRSSGVSLSGILPLKTKPISVSGTALAIRYLFRLQGPGGLCRFRNKTQHVATNEAIPKENLLE